MTPLWSSAEAAAACRGMALGRGWTAQGVSIDTRSLQPGDLFVALTDQRDGHDFVVQAFEKGAAAALVSRVPDGLPAHAPLLLVGDTLTALGLLAGRARSRCRARVVAVTGSVGKTSAKEMLRTALRLQGRTHAAEQSYNNHWGVPLTLARMHRETDFAVIEIGMNAPGEIAPLARLAQPHVGLITTVAEVHLEAFGTIEGIAHEKAALAEGVLPGGRMVLNADIRTLPILERAARRRGLTITTFGASGTAHVQLRQVALTETATTVRTHFDGHEAFFKVGAPGRHLAQNALGVLAAVNALGADPLRGALALATWSPPEGRGSRWIVDLGPMGIDGRIQLIDESFNASPAAMSAALEVFALSTPEDGIGRVTRGRRIAFLADMLELGRRSEALHAALAREPALDAIDLVHCAGPLMRALHEALPQQKQGRWYPSTAALADDVRRLVDAGDVALCKGSKGSQVGRVVQAIKDLGSAQPADEQRAE
ncbi:MAG: UDP-N-acetylmuramoyl-tripeptide--D-alanyl-D-alanine ligase [Pseudomonadota bacterium]